MSIEEIYNLLNNNEIDFKVIEHSAVYTIEDMNNLNLENSDSVAKNLFLKDDKKQNFYLVVLDNEKKVNLKELRFQLESRPLSFANEKYLEKYLNLEAGAVSPLGILNDSENEVIVVIDSQLKEKKEIAIHPNVNTATIFLKYDDLIKIIKQHGNKIIEVALK